MTILHIPVREWPERVVCHTAIETPEHPYEERTYVPREAMDKLSNTIAELQDEIYGLQCTIGNMMEERHE